MDPNKFRLQRPVHLVLDFDATLTVHDTLSLLREIPLQRNNRLGRELYPVTQWSSLEDAYMEDYTRHKQTEAQHEEKVQQAQTFVDRARCYSQLLAGRRVLEERSTQRVQDLDFFRGVTRADVCKAADTVARDGRLDMREHWTDLLQVFASSIGQPDIGDQSKVSIISLNWSSAFIRQNLLSALPNDTAERPDLASFIDKDVIIHSNEILGLDEPDGSDGKMQKKVVSNADKLKLLPPASRREDLLDVGREPDSTAPYLVYVGDSSTDFDCLMAADAGIWLYPASDRESAQERCERSFKPLELDVRPISDAGQGHVGENELVWAQDFKQITNFLLSIAP